MSKRNIFLNSKWLKAHLKEIKHKADTRYTPELNVTLPIAEIFDGLARTPVFYTSIRAHYGNLIRIHSRIKLKKQDKDLNIYFKDLNAEFAKLEKHLSQIKEYNNSDICWKQIWKKAKKSEDYLWELIRKAEYIREEQKNNASEDNKKDSDSNQSSSVDEYTTHPMYQLLKELEFFIKLSNSSKTKTSNIPVLLVNGSAGTGKTHLLCDIVQMRINELYPSILLFGEYFNTKRSIWAQIIEQLDIGKTIKNKSQLFKMLDSAGKKSNVRSLICIDALNESVDGFWKKNINLLVEEVIKYPNIGLVVSIRNGYENRILSNKKVKKKFTQIEHHGFTGEVMWNAVSYFFKKYNITFPEVPLLHPEFSNPLFLKFFCEKNKDSKPNLKGGNALKDVFEDFIIEIGHEVLKQLNPNAKKRDRGKNILWDYIVKSTALWMAQYGKTSIPKEDLLNIVKTHINKLNVLKINKSNATKVIDLMERRALLHKIDLKNKTIYRFTYNKFSDHIIVRSLLSSIKSKPERIKAFSKNGKFEEILLNFKYNSGILEALCIQVPEFCDGKELFELAPYLSANNNFQYPFRESLIWRESKYIGEKAITILKKNINKGDDFFYEPILSLASFPDNPLNAEFLHRLLNKFSMQKRDAWWSTYLHYEYSEKGAVNRLVEWAWSEQDKSHINDDAILLSSIALSWFLTTPNRFLRDKATKALVALLTNRINLVKKLLVKFNDVKDPYISERLYAVAYGCILRNRKDKRHAKELAQWVYGNIFKDGKPPAHILLRDYAYGVIQTALHNGVKLKINLKKIKPPYISDWPKIIPTEKKLKDKYYPKDVSKDRGYVEIWASLMSSLGDFGIYVLNPNLNRWSGRKLETNTPPKKVIFKQFKRSLSTKQKKLWKERNRFSKIDFQLLNSLAKNGNLPVLLTKKEENKDFEYEYKKQTRNTEKKFKESLNTKQRKIYEKEIKPYLNYSGGIDEPLKNFDNGLAQRWVFNRVVKLGWKPELHGEFDKNVNYYSASRTDHKAERIGKKYQWIAFHELLACVSDNFEFKSGSWKEDSTICKGPWQLSVRDIDPSCTLKDIPYYMPQNLPNIKDWQSNIQYNNWNKNRSDVNWLKKTKDLPQPQKIIDVNDNKGNKWLVLEGFFEWQEEIPPEQEQYHYPQKRLWYMVKSYIVKKKDFRRVYKWAKKQNYFERWMPESNEFSNIFLGEYPWAPAFLYYYSYYDDWTDETKYGEQKIPVNVLITDDGYFSSGQSTDCSTSEGIRVKLPANWLKDRMKINQTYVDGRFFDKNKELVTYDPIVFDDKSPKVLLINKEKLCKFLSTKGYSIFWTLLGEKSIIDELISRSDWKGKLDISGAFTLNSNNKIIGSMNTKFEN
jgi:hypothetical protein